MGANADQSDEPAFSALLSLPRLVHITHKICLIILLLVVILLLVAMAAAILRPRMAVDMVLLLLRY